MQRPQDGPSDSASWYPSFSVVLSTVCLLKGLLLKLQCFGHPMWRNNSLEKTLKLGKIEGKRRRGRQRMRWLDNIINSMGMNLSKLQEVLEDRGAWCATGHGVAKSQTELSNWTTTIPQCRKAALHDKQNWWKWWSLTCETHEGHCHFCLQFLEMLAFSRAVALREADTQTSLEAFYMTRNWGLLPSSSTHLPARMRELSSK